MRFSELDINGNKLFVEIAETKEETSKGLAYRQTLGKDQGMLFIFPYKGIPRTLSFWMKNTPLSLDLAYLNNDGEIVEIYSLEPFSTKIIHSIAKDLVAALEVNAGWFKTNNISKGAKISNFQKILYLN